MARSAYARLCFVLIIPVCLLCLHPVSATGFDDGRSQHIEHPDWFEHTPFNDLEGVLGEAVSDGKKGLMVLFTTEGCSYCELFIRKSLGDRRLASRVRAHFAAVGLEIFDDRELTDPGGVSMPVKSFAKREGAGFSPTLLFYGEGGKRLVRQVGYQSPERFGWILDYLIGDHGDRESLRDYLRRIQRDDVSSLAGAGLNSDPLFIEPPYALDRSRFAAEQPLLVIFEKADCPACSDFHAEVLAQAEVRGLLKQFDVVRLDAEANEPVVMPDGRASSAADWYDQAAFSRLPALVFFDEKGNRVLETDALVGTQRMLNSLHYVLQRAYEKDWTYQRFARSRAIERLNRNRQ